MQIISNSNPSATNLYLLKLEPGLYDLGDQLLTMLPYVDLEGSGEDLTTILSSAGYQGYPPPGGLKAASNSQIRHLTITNHSSPMGFLTIYQAAILVPNGATNVRIEHVNATSFYTFPSLAGDSIHIYSLLNDGGEVAVSNSTISASNNSQNGSQSTAIFNNSGTLSVTNSLLSASQTLQSSAINSSGGIVALTHATLTSSVLSQSYGLQINNNGACLIDDSTLTATNAPGANYGLFTSPAGCTINHSPLTASCQ
jgi:hypothetical protein